MRSLLPNVPLQDELLNETEVGGLDCQIHSGLEGVSAEDLKRLFPTLPDSSEMIRLTQKSGFDGFNFHSIVVRQRRKPILLLPLFETAYDLSTLLDGWRQSFLSILSRITRSRFFFPRVLAVGFVEGEWGEIGFDSQTDWATLRSGWDLSFKYLEVLAARLDVDILTFSNFNSRSRCVVPVNELEGFSKITGIPCAQLPILYRSVEEYISYLSKNMRKDLRRKMRHAAAIKIVRTREPHPWLEMIYRYYLETLKRSGTIFGIHRKTYFAEVAKRIPGAEYVLYFLGDTLVAFNLLIVRPLCLVDKYFGMDLEVGRKYSLYFVSWLENVRYCVENQIPLYHAGPGAEKTKFRLGSQFLPSMILFKHRNPFLHRLLTIFREYLSYKPGIDLPEDKVWGEVEEIPVS